MEGMVTQGAVHSTLTCIEESYCIGDVIIASTAVIGRGVILRADPGCSITIRDSVCLGPGVIIHATQGSMELHQGVCLAGGVLLVGHGHLGQQVCVGAGATLINPQVPDHAMIGAYCLWGDESRSVDCVDAESIDADIQVEETFESSAPSDSDTSNAKRNGSYKSETDAQAPEISVVSETIQSKTRTVTTQSVIGKAQFESMVKQMFPERDAFKRSQLNGE